VSKKFPAEAILEMAALGQSHFGENYVQEMQSKSATLESLRPATQFHMIGPLQRNKVNAALRLFDTIQSVDSLELLTAISKRCTTLWQADLESGKKAQPLQDRRTARLLIQVRLGEEASKSGFEPTQVLAQLNHWFDTLTDVQRQATPKIVGFMTIPPPVDQAEDNRVYFAQLRGLRDRALSEGASWLQGNELSMGMSDDFTVAIQEGATWVRVGRALFGERR
jgi:PLP dependent protein